MPRKSYCFEKTWRQTPTTMRSKPMPDFGFSFFSPRYWPAMKVVMNLRELVTGTATETSHCVSVQKKEALPIWKKITRLVKINKLSLCQLYRQWKSEPRQVLLCFGTLCPEHSTKSRGFYMPRLKTFGLSKATDLLDINSLLSGCQVWQTLTRKLPQNISFKLHVWDYCTRDTTQSTFCANQETFNPQKLSFLC